MLRGKRGISVTHLAAAAEASRQTIYAMEAGAYLPNAAVALRLARALNVTVEELRIQDLDVRAAFQAVIAAVEHFAGAGQLVGPRPVSVTQRSSFA
jgi:DNA-binding XRE family transcriptional regulator